MMRAGDAVRAAVIAGLLSSCVRPATPESTLQEALQAHLGAATTVSVGFLRNSAHLNLLLDGASFNSLPDSTVPGAAGDVAHYALDHYSRARELDSLTVRFVKFVPGAGLSYCGARSTTFVVGPNRVPSDTALIVSSTETARQECPK